MPELPEVETVANGVDARVRGERVEEAWFGEKPEPFKTPAREMAERLPGLRIGRVYRVGKHIVFDLLDGDGAPPAAQWIVHLGMTGRLLVADAGVELPAHTHAVLRLSSGRELRFADPRRFGRLALRELGQGPAGGKQGDARANVPSGAFEGPGTEPLLIEAEAFRALFAGRKTPIKAALLNQGLLHGVGNIYADESLFRAGIRPRRPARRVTRAEFARLHAALQAVLREAIRLGGSSVSDYVDAAGVRGFFQLEHRVYGRGGEPCRVCGSAIRRIVVGGRGTHYCSKCQR